ncbi:MAG: DUF937 domain-containing protein [Clostridiales bacterium]|nr:DUF937 domain-containing protein [Clostridiales bacterium]
MDLMTLLSSQLVNEKLIKQISDKVGVSPKQVEMLIKIGLPTLLQAMSKNANTKQGAESLDKALSQHQDDNIDNITDFLSNVDTKDGAKILQHILKEKNDQVQKDLSKQTGLNGDQVLDLMTQLAPLLMGTMGNQKKEKNLDIGDIIGSFLNK